MAITAGGRGSSFSFLGSLINGWSLKCFDSDFGCLNLVVLLVRFSAITYSSCSCLLHQPPPTDVQTVRAICQATRRGQLFTPYPATIYTPIFGDYFRPQFIFKLGPRKFELNVEWIAVVKYLFYPSWTFHVPK